MSVYVGIVEGVQVPRSLLLNKNKGTTIGDSFMLVQRMGLDGLCPSFATQTPIVNLHSIVPDGNKTWVISHKPGRIKGFSAFRFLRVSNYLHNNIEICAFQDIKRLYL